MWCGVVGWDQEEEEEEEDGLPPLVVDAPSLLPVVAAANSRTPNHILLQQKRTLRFSPS